MKAIGFKTSLSISDEKSFEVFNLEKPKPKDRDILVKVEAVSVNPVDFKVRQSSAKNKTLETPKIMGWDAYGVVDQIGDKVTLFKKGDKVFYAGSIDRPGSDQEYQFVDERIVGHAPKQISKESSAAMPLTSLTAWEILFDRIRVDPKKDKSVLIIGGAGGVGSIAIQIAKKVLGLKVIATASRPETSEWCKNLGADYVVNHKNLVDEVRKAGFKTVDIILDFVDLGIYWDDFVTLIKPQGRIGSITAHTDAIDLNQLKSKSVSFHWELMFTRPTFKTEDMIEQHHILNKIAHLLDTGIIKSTLNKTLNGFSIENLREAHRISESGKAIGKIAIKF